MSIFIVFENLNPIIWTSETLSPNSQISYIDQHWLIPINLFFKNEVFLSNSMLLENTGVDNTKSNFLKKINIFSKNQLIVLYTYYFYWLKSKLILVITTSRQNNNAVNNSIKIQSLDKIYKSSAWLERETGEMFGVKFFQ